MDLISLAKNPVPSGAFVGTFAGYDGVPLRFARWEPTRGPRLGTVVIVAGRGEFIEKYFETISDLRRRGYSVAIFDLRGQGASHRALSNSRKGHVKDFSEYERDLDRFMKDIVLPDCLPPFYALGHSMGGNILLRHAANSASWFDRLVLTAPLLAFADERVGYPQSMVRTYAGAGSMIGLASSYVVGGSDDPFDGHSEYDGNLLTSDVHRWERNVGIVQSAPEWSLGSPTVGWLWAAYRSCGLISSPDFSNRVKIPTLMFAAGQDKLVSTQAIEEFGVQLKVGSQLLIPNARHEILQETDAVRQRFWAAFDAYIGAASVAA